MHMLYTCTLLHVHVCTSTFLFHPLPSFHEKMITKVHWKFILREDYMYVHVYTCTCVYTYKYIHVYMYMYRRRHSMLLPIIMLIWTF